VHIVPGLSPTFLGSAEKKGDIDAISGSAEKKRGYGRRDCGQKPAKRGNDSELRKGKGLASYYVYFTSKYTQFGRFIKDKNTMAGRRIAATWE
jgi:hypothetical protein